jgi:hypothetical protein
MKKITLLTFALFALILSNEADAQCTDFSGGGPYTNFNSLFGGAPCDDGTGCPFNEISTFEVWADESYLMDNIVVGHTYTFSLCNGPGAGTWVPSFSIIAPSGAIDAFGLNVGSTCALTWTATEAGTYTIGISEAGIPCDSSTNATTNNGFPAITCTNGDTCEVCIVSAPDAVASAVLPADGATDVEIAYGEANNNLGPFEWLAATTGDPADDFNISFGTNPAADNIGGLSGFASGGSINFGWLPNTTYFWTIEAVNCAGLTPGTIWSFTTSACTDTAAPAGVSAPIPADAAPNVTLNADGNALLFNWTEGDPNATFTLNLGVTNPPTQPFVNFENGSPITGLAENTTYFWSIDAVNCFGTTAGTVWSFTTGIALSVEENQIETFSVYPNPTSAVLNIKSTKEIDNVTVFNLLGQSVARYNKTDLSNDSIDLSKLSNGLYLVRISAEGTTQTIRVNKE